MSSLHNMDHLKYVTSVFAYFWVHLTNYIFYITAADYFPEHLFSFLNDFQVVKIVIVEAGNLSYTFGFRYMRHFVPKNRDREKKRDNCLSSLISNICQYIFTHLQYMLCKASTFELFSTATLPACLHNKSAKNKSKTCCSLWWITDLKVYFHTRMKSKETNGCLKNR